MSNGVPVKWANTTLDSLCHIEMGQSPPSSTYNESGEGLPFFQGKAEFTDLYPIASKWCTQPGKTARKGDVLLSVRAPVGPTNLAPADCCIGRGLAALSPLGGIDSRYVMYAIRSGVNALKKLSTGSTFDAVSGQKVREFQIPVAPLNEQHDIVAKIEELLSDLDAGVAALERARANLTRYRAAVLKAAVEGKLTAEWRKANPVAEPADKLLVRILAERRRKWEEAQLAKYAAQGKTAPKGWKDKYPKPAKPDTSNLPELPEGWSWASLSQLGFLDRGKSKHRPRNAPFLFGGSYPFIQTGEVREADTFIRAFTQTYSEAGLRQSRLWPSGTLCITIAANIAETAVLTFDACFPDSVVGFLPASEGVSVRYIELYLRTVQAMLESLAPATAQKNINLETLQQVAVCLPPISEQLKLIEEIDQKLSLATQVVLQIEQSNLRASRLRQSILKRAFEGKLVPQEPSDEPATVLLDRIRARRKAEGLGNRVKREPKRRRSNR